VAPFPITRTSLRRKIWRDLSGKTGWKFAKGSWKRTFGRWSTDPAARRAAIGVAVTNSVLLAILTLAGHPALYLLWVAAWMTTNTLVTRIRAISEHALTPDLEEPNGRTRTTLARWWERLLIAPNRVNYHMEHHLLITVPHYHLPEMHRLLTERGVLGEGVVERGGYLAVLRRAASKPERTAEAEASQSPAPRIPPF
jgi:fatty acid desaturase